MGMFDEIHYQGRVWQTKDLNCLMEKLHVKDGRLIKDLTCWDPDGGVHKIGEVDTNFHGIIEVCDWVPSDTRAINEGRELEYRTLKFTDGTLVEEALVL